MIRLQAEIKRGFLRSLYRQVQTAAQSLPGGGDAVGGGAQTLTLKLTLDAFQDNGFMALQNGRLVVMSAGGGRTTTFQMPVVGAEFTQPQVFALAEELQQVYADALVVLSAQGITTPTDDQTFDMMMNDCRLQEANESYNDFSMLGWPYR